MSDETPLSTLNAEEIYEEVPAYMQNPDLWIYQLETKTIIDELIHLLRGEFWNSKANKWEVKGQQLLNEEGVRMLTTIVASHLSKEKILTDIPEEHVMRISKNIRMGLINHLTMECSNYSIKKSNLTIIVDIIDHYVFCNLSRGLAGRTLEYMKPTIKRVETVKPEKEPKGSWIPFFGGK